MTGAPETTSTLSREGVGSERSRLVLVGPPGAGKGTQCPRLAARLGVPHVSTGALFRDEVQRRTPLGRQVSALLGSGALVPDEVVVDVVARRLGRPDAATGYVLDGFPRTLAQACALSERFGTDSLDAVIELQVSAASVLDRLTRRRVCRDCGTPATTGPDPVGPEPRCAACGGETERRDDDVNAAVRRRLELYEAETVPMLGWFEERGILVRVDGDRPPDDVAADLAELVTTR